MHLLHRIGPSAQALQALAWAMRRHLLAGLALLTLLFALLPADAARTDPSAPAAPHQRDGRSDDITLRLKQAAILAEQQPEQAMEIYRSLIQEHPKRPEPYNNLAVLQARLGRYAEARANFEKALRTSPSHATAYDNLVQMYALQASLAYAKALQQRPASEPAPRFTMLQETTPIPGGSPARAQADPVPAQSGTASAPVRTDAAAVVPADSSWWQRLTGGSGAAVGSAAPATPTGSGMSLGSLAGLLVAALVCISLLVVAMHSRAASRSGPEAGRSGGHSGLMNGGPSAPEARLIEIYRLIGSGNSPEALAKAEVLVNEVPNFQLAQLVYGDLLMAQSVPLEGFGEAAAARGGTAPAMVGQLQQEAQKRLHALTAKPPANTVPHAFLLLGSTVRHAIAIDTSHSRLHLFELRGGQPVQIASYYVALGRQGAGKATEGDLRTPLGVYFVTGRLDTRELDDFYGAGALPLNYPNEHDRLQGRTGSDIWLHGVPSDQYSRPPSSTNGCIVLANDDLRRLWRDLAPVHTPVVITRNIDWVSPPSMAGLRKELLDALEGWRQARSAGDLQRTLAYYAADYRLRDAAAPEARHLIEREMLSAGPRERELKDISLLTWIEEGDRVVASFTEHVRGNRNGTGRRLYWGRQGGQWKIYTEGTVE